MTLGRSSSTGMCCKEFRMRQRTRTRCSELWPSSPRDAPAVNLGRLLPQRGPCSSGALSCEFEELRAACPRAGMRGRRRSSLR
jgi:hypothetical protein